MVRSLLEDRDGQRQRPISCMLRIYACNWNWSGTGIGTMGRVRIVSSPWAISPSYC
jgi:hypothetical protein